MYANLRVNFIYIFCIIKWIPQVLMKLIILPPCKLIRGFSISIIAPSTKSFIKLINSLIMYVNLIRTVLYRIYYQLICQNWTSPSHQQTFTWIWPSLHYVYYWIYLYHQASLRMIILYNRMVIFMWPRMLRGLTLLHGLIEWLYRFTLLLLLVRLSYTKIIRMAIVYNGSKTTLMLMLRMLSWVVKNKWTCVRLTVRLIMIHVYSITLMILLRLYQHLSK